MSLFFATVKLLLGNVCKLSSRVKIVQETEQYVVAAWYILFSHIVPVRSDHSYRSCQLYKQQKLSMQFLNITLVYIEHYRIVIFTTQQKNKKSREYINYYMIIYFYIYIISISIS